MCACKIKMGKKNKKKDEKCFSVSKSLKCKGSRASFGRVGVSGWEKRCCEGRTRQQIRQDNSKDKQDKAKDKTKLKTRQDKDCGSTHPKPPSLV
jgi:hypothetical protein